MEAGSCDAKCATAIITVGVMWGATNPFLRRAAARRENERQPENSIDSAANLCSRLFSAVNGFIRLMLDWHFSLPFALNQLASVVFQYLLISLPVSVVVPSVNALQVAASACVSALLSESTPSLLTAVGSLLVSLGVFIMISTN